MLTELHIQNFAIIQDLSLTFEQGLVIFTGETGAGKSIILEALEAVLGGRADTTSIRTDARRAIIEATFKLEGLVKERIHAVLQAEDLLDDPDYILLGREIRLEGRNTARINGHSVSAGLQREVGALLVDIHGQSEHLSLLKVRNHLDLLDSYANSNTLLASFGETYTQLRKVQKDLSRLRQLDKDSAYRTDMLTYQIQEIEAARLQAGEEVDLRQERTRLSNAENLSTLTQQALLLLDEGTPESASITDLLGEVVRALAELSRIDSSVMGLHERSETSLAVLSDLTLELHSYAEKIEFNPRRLDEIEDRINLFNGLKRKYGNGFEEIMIFLEQAQYELDNISNVDERIAELEAVEGELMDVLSKKGSLLSDERHAASKSMASAVEQQLDDLQMANARFAVNLDLRLHSDGLPLQDGRRVAFDASGYDQVEFLVEPNPGEGLKPLVKIASGGETSRLMLALKTVLASADTIPLLVFDEIDQGISGRVGMLVGEKLWQLSRQHQVMCVTHLSQLAAHGDQHFHVIKSLQDGRTVTEVDSLQGEARQKELAQMMGPLGEGTMQSANDLMKAVLGTKGK